MMHDTLTPATKALIACMYCILKKNVDKKCFLQKTPAITIGEEYLARQYRTTVRKEIQPRYGLI